MERPVVTTELPFRGATDSSDAQRLRAPAQWSAGSVVVRFERDVQVHCAANDCDCIVMSGEHVRDRRF